MIHRPILGRDHGSTIPVQLMVLSFFLNLGMAFELAMNNHYIGVKIESILLLMSDHTLKIVKSSLIMLFCTNRVLFTYHITYQLPL